MGDGSSIIGDNDSVSNINQLKDKAPAIFEKLWDHSLIGIAIVNAEGQFINANREFCSIVEYSEVELQGKTFMSITHPDDTASDVKLSRQVSSGARESYQMYKKYLTKTGGVASVRIKVVPIKDGDKFIFYLSQVVRLNIVSKPVQPEVSERKRAFSVKQITKKWSLPLGVAAYIITEVATKLIEKYS